MQVQKAFKPLMWVFAALLLLSGCGVTVHLGDRLEALVDPKSKKTITKRKEAVSPKEATEYYEKFFTMVSSKARFDPGRNPIQALDVLPVDGVGRVNWTAAVVQGLIAPRGSLDPNVEDMPPLSLNIFIEAKTPLMANVLFPHSIHTYWLKCSNCHPKIFLPEAGANPISMKEIWKGEWCGRCHGKIAFSPFMPRGNCTRCHVVLKGQSLEREHFN
jgi:c(7)-type cytochrome triheme protein